MDPRVLRLHEEYFNPRSSCEERLGAAPSCSSDRDFNPRSSCEERLEPDDYARSRANFNPRSSCEERLNYGRRAADGRKISIHAPHARSDDFHSSKVCISSPISIHAPHARSDLACIDLIAVHLISIHAPHARSDLSHMAARDPPVFQSTLLMRGATKQALTLSGVFHISIHAPHARSDTHPTKTCAPVVRVFQSTLLMRGATCFSLTKATPAQNFNPRSSCEERQNAQSALS